MCLRTVLLFQWVQISSIVARRWSGAFVLRPRWGNSRTRWDNLTPRWDNLMPRWDNLRPKWGNSRPSWDHWNNTSASSAFFCRMSGRLFVNFLSSWMHLGRYLDYKYYIIVFECQQLGWQEKRDFFNGAVASKPISSMQGEESKHTWWFFLNVL